MWWNESMNLKSILKIIRKKNRDNTISESLFTNNKTKQAAEKYLSNVAIKYISNKFCDMNFIEIKKTSIQFRIKHKHLQKNCLIKIYTGNQSDQNENELNAFINKAKLLYRIQNPYVVPFFDFDYLTIKGIDKPFIILDYIEGHTLNSFIKNSFSPFKNNLFKYIIQTTDGLIAASSFNYRINIASENIMIDDNDNIKIVDLEILPSNEKVDLHQSIFQNFNNFYFSFIKELSVHKNINNNYLQIITRYYKNLSDLLQSSKSIKDIYNELNIIYSKNM